MKINHNVRWLTVIMVACWFGWKPVAGHTEVLMKVGAITFSKPINKAPENDTFKYQDAVSISGQIAYSPRIEHADKRYVVIRTLKSGKQVTVQSLPVDTGFDIWGVEFSPDGQYVLFKLGTTTAPTDPFKVFFWNLKTQQITLGPTDLTFFRIRWAPSGKYIAYCKGGDRDGNEFTGPNSYSPLALYTFDLTTGKEYFIARAPSLRYFIWTNSGNLLFSMTSGEYTKQQNKIKHIDTKISPLLNIYQSPPVGEDIQLIVEDGYGPSPSPDGTKFIFVSYENIDVRHHLKDLQLPTDNKHRIAYPYLTLYDSIARTFKEIKDDGQGRTKQVLWMPDSKSILIEQDEYLNKKGSLRVWQIDLDTMKSEEVASFTAQDEETFPRSLSTPQFNNLNQPGTANLLFVQARIIGKLVSLKIPNTNIIHRYYKSKLIMKAADLIKHRTFQICDVSSTYNFSWHSQ